MHDFWPWLQTQPLSGLVLTLAAWELAARIDRRLRHPFTNPTLLAILAVVAILLLTRTPYAAYFTGAQYVNFLLGPATVALAIPMYHNLPAIKRDFLAIAIALIAGSLVAASSAMLIAHALGAPHAVTVSLGAKSVTTPIAMGIVQGLGGLPSLTAVLVIVTGLFCSVIFPFVFRALRVSDWRARGLAAGTAGHGIATARILTINETAGAFGGLAIGLNGVVTSLALPLLVWLFGL